MSRRAWRPETRSPPAARVGRSNDEPEPERQGELEDPCIGIELWVVYSYRPGRGQNKEDIVLRPHSNEVYIQTGHPILGTLNGQNQGEMTAQLLRDLHLGMVARHIVIHIDSSRADSRIRRQLFSSDREGFKDGPVLTSLVQMLEKMLGEDETLFEIERELTEKLAKREAQSTSEDVKRQIVKLLQEAGLQLRIEGPTNTPGEGEEKQPVKKRRGGRPVKRQPLPTLPYPQVTKFEIVRPEESLKVHIGDSETVMIHTDADAEYGRQQRLAIRAEPDCLELAGQSQLNGGRARWRLRPRHTAKIGDVGKGVVADYLASQLTRLRRCIELAGYQRLGDVRRGTLPALIEQLKAYEEPATRQRLTASTINYYLATLRQFVRWAVKTERLAQDPLLFEGGIKNDDRGKRRDVLVEELAEIVVTARSGTVPRMRMAGEDRAMLYLAAYATGFRRTELRLLQVEWLRLDAKPPGILLPAGITGKHRKATVQPLPAWFAAELNAWVGDRRGGPVWPYMPLDVAGVFDRDREAARAAWVAAAPDAAVREERERSDFLKRETADGEVVFHSHRHAYSTLVVMNMDLKSAQRLTRHATTEILAEVYTHSRASTAAEGVEKSIKAPVRRDTPAAGEPAG